MRRKLRYDSIVCSILANMGFEINGRMVRFDGQRADAGESLFILQELQAIEQQLYETPFGPRLSDRLIPMMFDVPAGAQEWGYDRVTPHGVAQWISADSKDIPWADVDRKRVTFPLNSFAAGYRYTRQDLLSAMMSNMPLDASLARQARAMIDDKRDLVLINGDADLGYTGLINNADVTIAAVAHGKWDGTGATPDQIIAEINTLVYAIGSTTKRNYYPDTLVVPTAVYAHLTTTPRSSTSDTTIWEFIVKNNQYLKNLEMMEQLSGAGVSGVDRALLYKRDPMVVVAKISVVFEQLPPQPDGFAIKTPCWGRIGGTHFRVPIAATYVDGV